MDFTRLGRTELTTSIIGLGCGGPSRLGIGRGGSVESAVNLVSHALDRGINLLDLAGPLYGTDEIVAAATRSCRSSVILSTKVNLGPSTWKFEANRTAARVSARVAELTSFVTTEKIIESRLEQCLRRLRTDYIDLLHLHSVTPHQYHAVAERVLPVLKRLQDKGKVRYIGITEAFGLDASHRMLSRAVKEGRFDVIMIGFDILNTLGAAIAQKAREVGTGIMGMYAIRRCLCNEAMLQTELTRLARHGHLTQEQADVKRLIRLLNRHGVSTLAEAAFRFSRYELNPDVVLTGTGDTKHLDANTAACHAGPLPERVLAEFRMLFTNVNTVAGASRRSYS